MKTFTDRERQAAIDWLEYLTPAAFETSSNESIFSELAKVISDAEGYPAGSGDRYVDTKNFVLSCMAELNKALKQAGQLGCKVEVSFSEGRGLPPPFPTEISLDKFYKEF